MTHPPQDWQPPPAQYRPPAGQHQPPPAGQYQPPPQQAYGDQPPPAPAQRRGRLLLAGLAGFLVAALIGLVLVVTGVVDVGGGGSSGPSTTPLSLPTALGPYVRFADARANQQAPAQVVAQRAADDSRTARDLTAAHDGAAAAVESYADQSLATIFTVWAVRDATPRPVVFDVTGKEGGTALPYREVRKIGSSYCELTTTKLTPYGSKPPPNSQVVDVCQRSEPGLTVSLSFGTESLFDHPTRVVALLDEVWSQLH